MPGWTARPPASRPTFQVSSGLLLLGAMRLCRVAIGALPCTLRPPPPPRRAHRPPRPRCAAVKLTDEQKADAYYLRKMEEAVETTPAPAPVAAPAPAPAQAEEKPAKPAKEEEPATTGPTTPAAPAPVEVPKDGASTLSAMVAAAAAALSALLLAL